MRRKTTLARACLGLGKSHHGFVLCSERQNLGIAFVEFTQDQGSVAGRLGDWVGPIGISRIAEAEAEVGVRVRYVELLLAIAIDTSTCYGSRDLIVHTPCVCLLGLVRCQSSTFGVLWRAVHYRASLGFSPCVKSIARCGTLGIERGLGR